MRCSVRDLLKFLEYLNKYFNPHYCTGLWRVFGLLQVNQERRHFQEYYVEIPRTKWSARVEGVSIWCQSLFHKVISGPQGKFDSCFHWYRCPTQCLNPNLRLVSELVLCWDWCDCDLQRCLCVRISEMAAGKRWVFQSTLIFFSKCRLC